MKLPKLAPLLIILVLAIILFWVKRNQRGDEVIAAKETKSTASKSARGLNRYPEKIIFSPHAKCRMQCRDITEAEIKKVLQKGKINYRKSELQKEDCQKRYAVEDIADSQRIRIIVAQCHDKLTVITCIDLDKEWSCACK